MNPISRWLADRRLRREWDEEFKHAYRWWLIEMHVIRHNRALREAFDDTHIGHVHHVQVHQSVIDRNPRLGYNLGERSPMPEAKELTELVLWAGDVGVSIRLIAADKKITLGDAPHLFKILSGAPVAIIGIDGVPTELAAMTDEVRKSLADQLAARLVEGGIDPATVDIEKLLNGALSIATGTVLCIQSFEKKPADSTL